MSLTNKDSIELLFDIYNNNELDFINEFYESYITEFKNLINNSVQSNLILIKMFEQNYNESLQVINFFIEHRKFLNKSDILVLNKTKKEIEFIYQICSLYIDNFRKEIKDFK